MAINSIAVSDEDVAKALRIQESHFVDVKGTGVARHN
jgi:hypothetical protein